MLKIVAAALMSGLLALGLVGCQKQEPTGQEKVETKVETTKEMPADNQTAEPASAAPSADQAQQPAAETAQPTENKPADENKAAEPAPAQ